MIYLLHSDCPSPSSVQAVGSHLSRISCVSNGIITKSGRLCVNLWVSHFSFFRKSENKIEKLSGSVLLFIVEKEIFFHT